MIGKSKHIYRGRETIFIRESRNVSNGVVQIFFNFFLKLSVEYVKKIETYLGGVKQTIFLNIFFGQEGRKVETYQMGSSKQVFNFS